MPVETKRPLLHETWFSSEEFAEAWVRLSGGQERLLAVPVTGSGPPRTMYGVQTVTRLGLRSVSLGPHGFYASPGWEGDLEVSTLRAILRYLNGLRTVSVVWNVRFDHESMAAGLSALGLTAQRISTHVLSLEGDYDSVFSRFHADTRNKVRKARRKAVRVRVTRDRNALDTYYQLHLRLVSQKGGYTYLFPLDFLYELIRNDERSRFLVAEQEGRIIAGGLFLRDGESVFYLHGATDRDCSNLHPSCALFDEAIRWGCETGATFFNFGNSGGIASLERFKDSWGTRLEHNWVFEWRKPLWTFVARVKNRLTRLLHPGKEG